MSFGKPQHSFAPLADSLEDWRRVQRRDAPVRRASVSVERIPNGLGGGGETADHDIGREIPPEIGEKFAADAVVLGGREIHRPGHVFNRITVGGNQHVRVRVAVGVANVVGRLLQIQRAVERSHKAEQRHMG